MSQPWKRNDFHHSNLIEWVILRRAEFIKDIFILVRAWVSAGKTYDSDIHLGGFSEWVNIIGGILKISGVIGFLSNLETLYDNIDEEGSQWEAFLLAIFETFHQEWFTSSHLSDALLDYPRLVDALPDEFDSPFRYPGAIDPRFKHKLGIELKKHINTRYGSSQIFIDHDKDEHLKIAKWRVMRGDAGTCGTYTDDLDYEIQF